MEAIKKPRKKKHVNEAGALLPISLSFQALQKLKFFSFLERFTTFQHL